MADLNTFLKRLDEQVAAARTKVEQKQSEIAASLRVAQPNAIRPFVA